ncbi:MAG: calcium-binding protein, partial [Hansschlegelia sp.]
VTSLREAITQAGTAKDAVEISFDREVFHYTAESRVDSIALQSTLTISKGDITIDGQLSSSSLQVTLTGGSFGTLVEVGSGAQVTMRDLNLGSSQVSGANGSTGSNGLAGGDGVDGADATLASSGGDGTDAPDSGTDGGVGGTGGNAVGGIVNEGALTLERVELRSMTAEGGRGATGGVGGRGGDGGDGGDGFTASTGVKDPDTNFDIYNPTGGPGNGGDGGDGGRGGAGGDGGDAVGGILNLGSLTLRDATFVNMRAEGGFGGIGGIGGAGGWGGAPGGQFVNFFAKYENMDDFPSPHGGDGGDGGQGGNAGDAGDGVSSVLNRGSVVIEGAQTGPSTSEGTAGSLGIGEDGGLRGLAGNIDNNRPIPFNYTNWPGVVNGELGDTGARGLAGAHGADGDFAGFTTATVSASFIIRAATLTVDEAGGKFVQLVVERIGDVFQSGSVDWAIKFDGDATATDFVSGQALKGTSQFPSGISVGATSAINIQMKDDALKEGDETFTVELSKASGGSVGYTKAVTVTIHDDDGPATSGPTGGDDVLPGGPGKDTVHALGGDDKVSGLGGNDKLYGDAGDDTLDGGDGNDKLYGGDGNDSLIGGLGNDLLDGGAGKDKMAGGAGNDAYVVDAKGDKITEKAGQGVDAVKAAIDYKLGANVETLTLTGSGDVDGTGNGLANKITGNKGDNRIEGGGGADVLKGAKGDDVFVFGKHFGADKVSDFAAGDSLLFDHKLFKNDAAVFDAAHQAGKDVVIDAGGGDAITLVHVKLAALDNGDFSFF